MKSLLLSEHDPPPHSTAGRVIVLAFTKGSLLWSNTASVLVQLRLHSHRVPVQQMHLSL